MPYSKPSDAVKNTECGVLINIHVISHAKEIAVGFNAWKPRLKVKVSSQPIKGRANEEIQKLFKRLLGNCEIIAGKTSNKKTLLIRDCNTTTVMKKIETTLDTSI